MAIKIRRNTAVFKQVARALGARRAIRELQRVAAAPCCDFDQDAYCIASSFYWNQTPQGVYFWHPVAERTKK